MVSDLLVGFLILLLFVYVIFMCVNKKFKKEDCTLLSVALVLLLVVYVIYMIKVNKVNKVKEAFSNPASLDYKMGKFTGLDVHNDDMPYNNLTSAELVAKNNVLYHSPIGTPHNLNPDKAVGCNLPSVDGTKNAPKGMAILAYNRSSPDCCPSTYSNSMGCVCLTDNQKEYLNSGGRVKDSGNKLISGNISN